MQRPVQLLPDAQLQKTPGSRISVRKHTEQPRRRGDGRAVGIKLSDTFAASANEAKAEANSVNRDAKTAFGRFWQARAHRSPSGIFSRFYKRLSRGHIAKLEELVFTIPVCCGLNLCINCGKSPNDLI